ncbi:MAG: hypothetical protein ACR2PM_14020 [Hyphomicrobiales bacterium]
MVQRAIDPLTVARAASRLEKEAEVIGVRPRVSFDFEELGRVRDWVRQSQVTPFFRPEFNAFSPETAFWVSAMDSSGEVIYLHAFRLDIVQQDFSQWFLNWMFGLRARVGDRLVLETDQLPTSNRMRALRGRLVYQGELWVSQTAPRKFASAVLNLLPRFSMLLAYMHFRPDAIWAIVDHRGATTGGVLRAGNPHVQPDYVRWKPDAMPSDVESKKGAPRDPSEWLSTVEREELELMISEILWQTDRGDPTA